MSVHSHTSETSQSSGGVQLCPEPPQAPATPGGHTQAYRQSQLEPPSPSLSDTSSLSLASPSLGYKTRECTNWRNDRPLWGGKFEYNDNKPRDNRPYDPSVDERERIIVAGERVYRACYTPDHERHIVTKVKYAPGVRNTQWRPGAGGGRNQYMPLQSETRDQFYESSRSPEPDPGQGQALEQDQTQSRDHGQCHMAGQGRAQDRERSGSGSGAYRRGAGSWRRSDLGDGSQAGNGSRPSSSG